MVGTQQTLKGEGKEKVGECSMCRVVGKKDNTVYYKQHILFKFPAPTCHLQYVCDTNAATTSHMLIARTFLAIT